jgi:iron complex outermembrane receptor protein
LVGGFSAVDARTIDNPSTPANNGSLASNVSPFSGKAYVEYKIPYYDSLSFLQGLTLIGGFQAASWYYGDYPNTVRIPGHIVGDLGFRYTTKVYDHPLSLRFNVNNFTNTGYWLSGQNYEGLPRTFLATAEIKW